MKYLKVLKIAVLFFAVAAMFAACSKDTSVISDTEKKINEVKAKQSEAISVDFYEATPDFKLCESENIFVSEETEINIGGSTFKSRTIGTRMWAVSDSESGGNLSEDGQMFAFSTNQGTYHLWADVSEAIENGWRFPNQADIQALVSSVKGYVARIPILLSLKKGNPYTWDGVNLVTNPDGTIWYDSTDSFIFWSNTTVTNPPSGYNEAISIIGTSLSYRQIVNESCIKVRLVKDVQ